MAQASQNNSWVESYLDALLSYGLSSEYQNKPVHDRRLDAIDPDAQVFSKYYLSQILQLDEQGIRDAWHKAVSTRNYGQKDQRLEHLSWRVWFMKRARSRVAWEEGHRIAATIPDESDAFEDYTSEEDDSVKGSSKDGKESPRGPGSPSKQLGSSFSKPAQAPQAMDIAPIQEGQEFGRAASAEHPADMPAAGGPLNTGLYIILISMHGLVRGDRMELGKDPDTGGQVKYVVELARALAQHPAVFRVDLLTRKIKDSKVDSEYSQDEECLLPGEGLGGAYICRLPCGNEMQYLHKEALWPHVREFADRGLQHAHSTLKRLSGAHTPCELYVVHGHYADAGEVAALMSSSLGIDMVLTGHSLGRNKLEHLLASGTVNRKEIEMTYKISRRIEAEERALENAMMVFTSTQQEVDEQWGLYDSFDAKLEAALRHRRRGGRHMPYMRVIPPGLDFTQLKVDLPKDPALEDFKHVKPAFGASPPASDTGSPHSPAGDHEDKESIKVPAKNVPKPQEGGDAPIWREIFRFLSNPRKPCILAMSRPDAKKNITTLVKAFGEHPQLRKLANLVLVMGNRESIDGMAGGSAKVIQQVLKLVDGYDLYGSVAYPKRHTQADISDIYRLPLATRGVFTNVALQEPFGLTVIEAAAHGVPTVATKNGGPVDIMSTLHHGLLVDPASSNDIASACFKLLTNSSMWDQMSHNGVANIMAYSWPSHCKRYLDSIEAEKRYLRSQQPRGGVTGSLDHTKPFPGSGGKASAHALVRVGSTPHGRHGHHHTRRPSGKNFAPKQSPRGSSRITPTKPSKLGSDQGAISSHFSGQLGFEAEEGEANREHIIVLQFDGECQTEAFLGLAKQAVSLVESGDGAMGLGIVSILGFEDSYRILEGGGLVMEHVDWIVCNSGADIWHNFREAQDKTGWHADEAWEEHINFRWERTMIAKMVSKLLSGDKDMKPGASQDLGMSRALSTALGALGPQEQGTHPHHVLLAMNDELKQQIDMGARTRQKEAISNVIVERIRRRLRHNALRNHSVLQMVPEGDDLQSHMHITPCRASRALALRFLALKSELTMGNMTVVCLPARVTHQDEDKIRVTGHTSDLSELISGLCKAVIVEPRSDARQARKSTVVDSALMDRLAVKVVPSLFEGRIQFLKDASALSKVLKQ